MSSAYRKFFILWFSSLVSATGSGMTSFALGVYIYQQTGQSGMTGLFLLLGFLPGLLLSPLAGLLADRYDRRLLMIMGDGLSMIGLLSILSAITLFQGHTQIVGIGLGIVVSSAFSSLIEPSFRATISDLLPKEDYSKASGMMQIVSSARYLLSPILAGFLLHRWGIRSIVVLDLLTILLTLPITFLVRQAMRQTKTSPSSALKEDLRLGFQLLYEKKGIWLLVLFGIWISFCLGTVQTLMGPMILSFEKESFLGFATTFSACGMLAGGLFLSSRTICCDFTKIFGRSLLIMGLSLIGFAARENKFSICLFGFCLFATLPFANMSMDYLVRTNIAERHQGKVWGMIGILSQTGYLFAYAFVGWVADRWTRPLLLPGGRLAENLGDLIGTGEGRGAALMILLAGIFLSLSALIVSQRPEIQQLEAEHVLETV